jgi:hypothetical protein
MTTEPPIITRADLQAAFLKKCPMPSLRAPQIIQDLWLVQWHASYEYAKCCELSRAEMARNCTETARHGVFGV